MLPSFDKNTQNSVGVTSVLYELSFIFWVHFYIIMCIKNMNNKLLLWTTIICAKNHYTLFSCTWFLNHSLLVLRMLKIESPFMHYFALNYYVHYSLPWALMPLSKSNYSEPMYNWARDTNMGSWGIIAALSLCLILASSSVTWPVTWHTDTYYKIRKFSSRGWQKRFFDIIYHAKKGVEKATWFVVKRIVKADSALNYILQYTHAIFSKARIRKR